MDKIYIIIPAYNEEYNIESVIDDWYSIVSKMSKSSKNNLNKTPKKVVQRSKTVDTAGEEVTMTNEHPFEYGPTRNNGQAVFVPHYLRWKDPTLHNVLMSPELF